MMLNFHECGHRRHRAAEFARPCSPSARGSTHRPLPIQPIEQPAHFIVRRQSVLDRVVQQCRSDHLAVAHAVITLTESAA